MTKDLWRLSHLFRVDPSSAPPGTSNGHTRSDVETTGDHSCMLLPWLPEHVDFARNWSQSCRHGKNARGEKLG